MKPLKDILSAYLSGVITFLPFSFLAFSEIHDGIFTPLEYFSLLWPMHITTGAIGALAVLPILLYNTHAKYQWITDVKKQHYTIYSLPFFILSYVMYGLLGSFVAFYMFDLSVFGTLRFSMERVSIIDIVAMGLWFWLVWFAFYSVIKILITQNK
ncbi:MAG: hypothetical protein ACP6IU_03955 [Candidatus Asgardarchaeia archaeon]